MATITTWKLSSILGTVVATTSATVGTDMTLSPVGVSPDGWIEWEDRSGGIAVVYPRIRMLMKRPNKASKFCKVRVQFLLPTADITAPTTVTGIQPAPSKAYDTVFDGVFVMPERGTIAERTKLASYVPSMFFPTVMASDGVPSDTTNTPLLNAIINWERPYG